MRITHCLCGWWLVFVAIFRPGRVQVALPGWGILMFLYWYINVSTIFLFTRILSIELQNQLANITTIRAGPVRRQKPPTK